MADDTDHEKQDIAELARTAADAVSKLAVEVGRMVMDGVRSAFDAARTASPDDSADPNSHADETPDTGDEPAGD
jgi:hypothetical protein